MLTLMTFPPGLGEPSLSPYCLKVMCLLDMAGQDWQPEYHDHPGKAPAGKLPALRTPDGIIHDSNFILTWLEALGADLFPGLGPKDRAQAHAIMRLAESSLGLGLIHDRWMPDEAWTIMKPILFGNMPAPLRAVLPGVIRRTVRKGLLSHGFGRLTEPERMAWLQADLNAVTDLLGDQDYLFGDLPCAADASLLPFLSMMDRLPTDTPLRRAVRANAALMAYVERGRAALWPSSQSTSRCVAA